LLGKAKAIHHEQVLMEGNDKKIQYDYLIVCTGSRYSEIPFANPLRRSNEINNEDKHRSRNNFEGETPQEPSPVIPSQKISSTIQEKLSKISPRFPSDPIEKKIKIFSARLDHLEDIKGDLARAHRVVIIGGDFKII
jgi:hypothetical protein